MSADKIKVTPEIRVNRLSGILFTNEKFVCFMDVAMLCKAESILDIDADKNAKEVIAINHFVLAIWLAVSFATCPTTVAHKIVD